MHGNSFYSLYGTYGSHAVFSGISPHNKSTIKYIATWAIIQCILVFIGAAVVLSCVFIPNEGFFELDILARIMYLYDIDTCGAQRSITQINILVLSNDTRGLPVIPIRNEPVVMKVLSRLTGKTRKYLITSIFVHVLWLLSALTLRCGLYVQDMNILKILLRIFHYVTILIICFDISMGIVYIAHIQQSLTKAMIIRYSGWAIAPAIQNTEEFGGWVPMIASACWLRGIIVFIVNAYHCRVIRRLIRKIKKREVKSRLSDSTNVPYPEPNDNQQIRHYSLYYRAGEKTPYYS